MAKSIIQRALAGHPNWSGAAQHRASVGSAGSALTASQGKPKGGVASAGGALLGAAGGGSGPGATAVAQTPAPAAQASAGPTVQPFLTPEQQQALDNWNAKYGGEIAKLGQADTDALGLYNTTVANNNLVDAKNQDITNQSMGARGLAISSVHQGALNDLATTLAKQNNLALTNYNTTLSNDQTARTTLSGENDSTQNYYSGLAVANAQGVTPSGAAPTPAPSTTNAPAASNPQQSHQPNHQGGVGSAGSALLGGHSNLTGGLSGIGMAGAALQRAQPVTQHIRPPGSSAGGNLGVFGNLLK